MTNCLGRGESVVVVDDVEVQREIATQMLTRLGYSVRSFASGEEAVEYMKDHSADLMILDMIMDPGIDGLETYRRVLEYHPGQKAIIASGYSETQRVRELQLLGAGLYIKTLSHREARHCGAHRTRPLAGAVPVPGADGKNTYRIIMLISYDIISRYFASSRRCHNRGIQSIDFMV